MRLLDFLAVDDEESEYGKIDPDTWEPDEAWIAERTEEKRVSAEVNRRRGYTDIDTSNLRRCSSDATDPRTGERVYVTDWAELDGLCDQLVDELLMLRHLHDADSVDFSIGSTEGGFDWSLTIYGDDTEWGRLEEGCGFQTAKFKTRALATCAAWCAAYDSGWFNKNPDWSEYPFKFDAETERIVPCR